MFDALQCERLIRDGDHDEQAIRRAVVSAGGRCGIVTVTRMGNRWLAVYDAEDVGKANIIDTVYLGQGVRQ